MKERPTIGIATDGAHSTKERLTRCRAGDLFSEKDIPYSGRKLDKQHRRVSWDCRSSKIHSGKPRQPSHHLLRQHHRYNMVQEYENCLFKALSSVT